MNAHNRKALRTAFIDTLCHLVALGVGLAFTASPHKFGQAALLGLPLVFVGALGIVSTLHDALEAAGRGRHE